MNHIKYFKLYENTESLCKKISIEEYREIKSSKRKENFNKKEFEFISNSLEDSIPEASIYNNDFITTEILIITNYDEDDIEEDQISIEKYSDEWWIINYRKDINKIEFDDYDDAVEIRNTYYLLDTLDGLKEFVKKLDY